MYHQLNKHKIGLLLAKVDSGEKIVKALRKNTAGQRPKSEHPGWKLVYLFNFPSAPPSHKLPEEETGSVIILLYLEYSGHSMHT